MVRGTFAAGRIGTVPLPQRESVYLRVFSMREKLQKPANEVG